MLFGDVMKLLVNAVLKFVIGILLIATLVFLPAGTLNYTGGWLFIALLFIPVFIMGVVLFLKAPDLLKKRLNSKEKESTQKGVVAFSGVIFLVGFVVSGLDFRFSWSYVNRVTTFVASVLFIVGYIIYAEVMRENAYLSRTIEVQENQKVIDTGLYGIIRHPMYLATIIMFLMIPLILGSWYALAVFCMYPLCILLRIKNEENILTEQLEGYSDYVKKVKYKIIPFVW